MRSRGQNRNRDRTRCASIGEYFPSGPSYDRNRGYTRSLGVKQIRPKGRSEELAARAIDAGSEVKSRQGEHFLKDTPPRML